MDIQCMRNVPRPNVPVLFTHGFPSFVGCGFHGQSVVDILVSFSPLCAFQSARESVSWDQIIVRDRKEWVSGSSKRRVGFSHPVFSSGWCPWSFSTWTRLTTREHMLFSAYRSGTYLKEGWTPCWKICVSRCSYTFGGKRVHSRCWEELLRTSSSSAC